MPYGYTIPAGQAVGSNVQFKRAAYTDGCAERMFTNTITITWCNLYIGGVCWADENVAQPGTFAPRPDMYTELYQWNQPDKALPISGAVTEWTNNITAPAWTSTPCPKGWRMPTPDEYRALNNAGGEYSGNAGGTWAVAEARGAAVAGRFYGPNSASCSLPNNMTKCVFFPVGGRREGPNGSLINQSISGYAWHSMQYSSTNGYYLSFHAAASVPATNINKEGGLPVRCVQ